MSLEDTDDALMRRAAFDHVRALQERHDALTSEHLKAGFPWQGQRIPLVNPQRGIFKPRSMRHLLSIRTVYPRKHAKVWYGVVEAFLAEHVLGESRGLPAELGL